MWEGVEGVGWDTRDPGTRPLTCTCGRVGQLGILGLDGGGAVRGFPRDWTDCLSEEATWPTHPKWVRLGLSAGCIHMKGLS